MCDFNVFANDTEVQIQGVRLDEDKKRIRKLIAERLGRNEYNSSHAAAAEAKPKVPAPPQPTKIRRTNKFANRDVKPHPLSPTTAIRDHYDIPPSPSNV